MWGASPSPQCTLALSLISTGYLPISRWPLLELGTCVHHVFSPKLPSQEVSVLLGRWPGTRLRICGKLPLSSHKQTLEERTPRSAQNWRMLWPAVSSPACWAVSIQEGATWRLLFCFQLSFLSLLWPLSLPKHFHSSQPLLFSFVRINVKPNKL